MLRRPEGEVGRQNRKRDLDTRVTHPAPQPQHQPTDSDPPDDLAGDDRAEGQRGTGERKCPGADRGYGEAVEDERSGVVGQALALEDKEDALGKPQPARDRERRDRVGGETIAPSRKPTGQGTDKTNCAAAATATVVNMTHPNASRVIGRRLNRKSRQLIDTADE